MAVCTGCGLEVVDGKLRINVCDNPVVANPTTTGGLVCNPSVTGVTGQPGCLSVVLNDSHAGCGLNAVGGALVVDPCNEGGIVCGGTADDPGGQCIYIDVQGQGDGACIPLANVNGTAGCGPFQQSGPFPYSACPSLNCNGAVRTCDGLWAPPALSSINFSCGQLARGPGTLANVLQTLGVQAGEPGITGVPLDGLTSHSFDGAYGISQSQVIIFNAFDGDPCNNIDAMSWTAFNIGYVVKPGELWRWALWERICIEPAPADVLTSPCTGNGGWALQALQYVDRRTEVNSAFETVQINDNSTWRFGKNDSGRMEAMITFNRLTGVGPIDNPMFYSNFQYRNMGHAYHYARPQECMMRDSNSVNDPAVFPPGAP